MAVLRLKFHSADHIGRWRQAAGPAARNCGDMQGVRGSVAKPTPLTADEWGGDVRSAQHGYPGQSAVASCVALLCTHVVVATAATTTSNSGRAAAHTICAWVGSFGVGTLARRRAG